MCGLVDYYLSSDSAIQFLLVLLASLLSLEGSNLVLMKRLLLLQSAASTLSLIVLIWRWSFFLGAWGYELQGSLGVISNLAVKILSISTVFPIIPGDCRREIQSKGDKCKMEVGMPHFYPAVR
jgi:hypothetical protein